MILNDGILKSPLWIQPRTWQDAPLLQDKGVVPRCARPRSYTGDAHTWLPARFVLRRNRTDSARTAYLMEQSALIPGQPTLFSTDPRTGYSEKVCAYIDKFWEAIRSGSKIDAARDLIL